MIVEYIRYKLKDAERGERLDAEEVHLEGFRKGPEFIPEVVELKHCALTDVRGRRCW